MQNRNRLHSRPRVNRVTESCFIDVRNPHTDKLIFRYDPIRNIVEHQARGVKAIIDLNQYIASVDVLVDIEQTV